ncbi:hypothetical protein [Thiobacillus sp.]|uniref:hypothetical protein n=1 Tax=Thiobacillus sp. TaxID=924 RepID=UPI001AD2E9BD|nr:hypothetical protein [Thiobacillus sp.]MBC2758939.1 hypothetical protein [Thiobacillus sp.]MBN8763995.1 hypothetical protein [Thiobacillus sp.]
MANMNLPIEVFDVFVRKFGREDAIELTKAIESTLTHIEERTYELVTQRKLEAKEELKIELKDQLATKADIARLEGDIKATGLATNLAITKLDKKFTSLWLVTIFSVLIVNQNALEFLAKLLGLIR